MAQYRRAATGPQCTCGGSEGLEVILDGFVKLLGQDDLEDIAMY